MKLIVSAKPKNNSGCLKKQGIYSRKIHILDFWGEEVKKLHKCKSKFQKYVEKPLQSNKISPLRRFACPWYN